MRPPKCKIHGENFENIFKINGHLGWAVKKNCSLEHRKCVFCHLKNNGKMEIPRRKSPLSPLGLTTLMQNQIIEIRR